MKPKHRSVRTSGTILLLFALVLLITTSGHLKSSAASETEPLHASGTIRGREVRVASEFGGRIDAMRVKAGDAVHAGDTLVALDSTPLQLQLAQAEAALATAQADRAVVEAGPRPAKIAAARAALALAEADRDGAQAAWLNAQATAENSQELNTQIIETRTQAALTAQNVELAKADAENARARRDKEPSDITNHQAEAAEAALASAQAQAQAALAALAQLEAIRQEPLGLIAQAHVAEGKYHIAVAGVAVAQAKLDDLLAGPTPEEIAVAEATVDQAQAQVKMLQTQLTMYTITSPIDGLVLDQTLRAGEIAAPAATILTLSNLQAVMLEVYVPEGRLGAVRLGQPVTVTVDSFPGRSFTGRVTRIADQPEFTPRNVATPEERLNTFYAVEISLPNRDGPLKLGMPADAMF